MSKHIKKEEKIVEQNLAKFKFSKEEKKVVKNFHIPHIVKEKVIMPCVTGLEGVPPKLISKTLDSKLNRTQGSVASHLTGK